MEFFKSAMLKKFHFRTCISTTHKPECLHAVHGNHNAHGRQRQCSPAVSSRKIHSSGGRVGGLDDSKMPPGIISYSKAKVSSKKLLQAQVQCAKEIRGGCS
ncbi:hypothetical protein TNCT_16421 [Trichonephila clavata]|uniref:Uncharacterized protein n=1 Tax=Trichonephila clavata TaxID=2740835 RepID=A0A8X6L1J0_TRICU|nr:hypothetical protein TNCT_16421 [Trichonephila clavata]